jgi:hypothetical protein
MNFFRYSDQLEVSGPVFVIQYSQYVEMGLSQLLGLNIFDSNFVKFLNCGDPNDQM